MSRISDENFESIVNGQQPVPPDLTDDNALAARLAGHRALKARLKSAFDGVSPDADFVARLKRDLAAQGDADAAPPVSLEPRRRSRATGGRFRRLLWPAMAAAATVALAISLSVLLSEQPATAAQEEFARIHRRYESSDADLHDGGDVDQMAAYLQGRLGYDPGHPAVGPGESVRGCCVDRFRGNDVALYVMETQHGVVSVVVTTAPPETMNLRHKIERDGRTLWACAFEECRMVALRTNGVTYVVVARLPHAQLIDLLLRIAPTPGPAAAGE